MKAEAKKMNIEMIFKTENNLIYKEKIE